MMPPLLSAGVLVDQNRYFRAIWRLNAVLLAVGGLLIVGFVFGNLLFAPHWEPSPQGQFAPVPKSAETDSTYRLEPTSVALVGKSIFSLRKWNGSPQSNGLAVTEARSEASYITPLNGVNLLAVDTSSGSGQWIFHGYSRAIVSEQGLERVTDNDNETPTALVLIIQTIDADTNKDGELTDKDQQSLYFYRPGMEFAEKFLDADYIISREQTSANTFLVVYERGKTAFAATFSIPGLDLILEKPIPSVPN